MLHRIAVLVALFSTTTAATAAPSPSPSPSATPVEAGTSPLKTIANIRATAACSEIVTHANGAIAGAIQDDQIVSQGITQLRLANLDNDNMVRRTNTMHALEDIAKNLMMGARSADNEVKRLRALAEKSSDPDQKKELKAFADELGGALWRQQKIARDLNGLLAAIDAHQMLVGDEDEMHAAELALGIPQWNPDPMPFQVRTGNPTDEARAAADDFQSRVPAISNDESLAADHAAGAFKGC
jgi:hypothetical protein